MNHQRKNYWIGFATALIGAVLFSTKAIFVKLAFLHTSTSAVTLLALRMIFSLPFYIGIAFWNSRQEHKATFTNREWVYVVLLGFVGYYLSSLFDFIGLQYVSAGIERLILFLYPTFTVVINRIVYKQPIHKNQMFALVLTYTGVLIAYVGELHHNTSNPNYLFGTFLIFLCSITFAFYLVGSGRLIPKVGATKFTSYAMMAAVLGVMMHYFITGNTIHHFSNELLGYGVVLAIVATVIPTYFISNAIKKIGSNNVAIIASIGPVSTIVQAHFVLGEHIFAAQIIGTILVIVGVLLISKKTAH